MLATINSISCAKPIIAVLRVRVMQILGFILAWVSPLLLSTQGVLLDTMIAKKYQDFVCARDLVVGEVLLGWQGSYIKIVEAEIILASCLVCLHLGGIDDVLIVDCAQQCFCMQDDIDDFLLNGRANFMWRPAICLQEGDYLMALGKELGVAEILEKEIIFQSCNIVRVRVLKEHAFCATKGLVVLHDCKVAQADAYLLEPEIIPCCPRDLSAKIFGLVGDVS